MASTAGALVVEPAPGARLDGVCGTRGRRPKPADPERNGTVGSGGLVPDCIQTVRCFRDLPTFVLGVSGVHPVHSVTLPPFEERIRVLSFIAVTPGRSPRPRAGLGRPLPCPSSLPAVAWDSR
jgi:hypothetical protein